MNDSLRHVLMLAYFYPPIENAGTRRSVKFVRYLPAYGYRPVVLSSGMRGTLPDDDAQLVFRSDGAVGALYRLLRGVRNSTSRPEAGSNSRLIAATNPLARLRERYLIPDSEATWYLPALRMARRLARALPLRLIYSTSSPETSHLVALRLKRELGLPWVADLRDGWMFEPLRAERTTIAWRRAIELRMERAVISGADRIVTVNDSIAADLARRYPAAAAKLHVITNGYDAADIADLPQYRRDPQLFRIVHTGALALGRAERSIDGLLTALRSLADSDADLAGKLRLLLVGELSPGEQAQIAASQLGPIVETVGRKPYRATLEAQATADLLLMVTVSGANGMVPGKLFEYLAVGRPILALSGPSPATRIIDAAGAGLAVEPHDSAGIARAIRLFYGQWQAGLLATHRSPQVAQYERAALTARLAAIFDSLH